MKSSSMSNWARAAVLPLIIAAVCICFFTSCFPGWIDSESFVYGSPTTGKIKIRNITTKTSKSVIDLPGAKDASVNFVLHPDRKKFAITRFDLLTKEQRRGKPKTILEVYSLEGKKLHTSPVIEMDYSPGRYSVPMMFLRWSVDGRQLIGCAGGITLIYDFETNQHRSIKHGTWGTGDAFIWPSAPPITPDGKKFLSTGAYRKGGLQTKLVDLTSGEAKWFKPDSGKEPKTYPFKDLRVNLPSYWRGNAYVSPINRGEYLFDTKALTWKFVETEAMKKLYDVAVENDQKIIADFGENALMLKPDYKNGARCQLSIYDFKSKAFKILDKYPKITSVQVVPAPDKKHTLVNVIGANYGLVVLVFDKQGKIIDTAN